MLKHIPILRDFLVSRKDYKELEEKLFDINFDLIIRNKELSLQKEINEIIRKKTQIITVVGFDDNSAEPSDPGKRAEYIKEVDIFYDNILKKKLTTSIADIRELLSNIHVANGFPQNMQRNEYDYFLRGMESFAWKIVEWSTVLQGERREVLQDKENQE